MKEARDGAAEEAPHYHASCEEGGWCGRRGERGCGARNTDRSHLRMEEADAALARALQHEEDLLARAGQRSRFISQLENAMDHVHKVCMAHADCFSTPFFFFTPACI
jgi:hypothetical protein